MDRLLLALALGAVAVGFALWIQRRHSSELTDSVGEFKAPEKLDRADFERPEAPWLVAVFTSASCSTCADVWVKAKALASPQVQVQQVEQSAEPKLHRRYDIRAVPIVAIADAHGKVRASFMGPVPATHLWAGLAELRDPGSAPSDCAESAAVAQLPGTTPRCQDRQSGAAS